MLEQDVEAVAAEHNIPPAILAAALPIVLAQLAEKQIADAEARNRKAGKKGNASIRLIGGGKSALRISPDKLRAVVGLLTGGQ